jgi:prepilin-type N-terminal cleavage/methylation domain-containing protein
MFIRGERLNQRGFSLVESTVAILLLGICALGAASGSSLLAKGQKKIITSAEFRSLLNDVRATVSTPKTCTTSLTNALVPFGGSPTVASTSGTDVILKQVLSDGTLGNALVSPGMTYGPLKIISAKLIIKQKLTPTRYLMGYQIVADRGSDPTTGAPTSLGGQTLTDTIPFAILIDTSGKIADCSLADSISQVDLVQQVSCDYLGDLFVWDKSLQTCVFRYSLFKYYGGPYHSIPCPTNAIPVSLNVDPNNPATLAGIVMGATIGGDPNQACASVYTNADGTWVGASVTNTYSYGGTTTTVTSNALPWVAIYNSSTRSCDCYYASTYQVIGYEQCMVQCGTPKVF